MNIKRTHIFKLNTSIMALASFALIVFVVVYSGFALAAKPGHIAATVRPHHARDFVGHPTPG